MHERHVCCVVCFVDGSNILDNHDDSNIRMYFRITEISHIYHLLLGYRMMVHIRSRQNIKGIFIKLSTLAVFTVASMEDGVSYFSRDFRLANYSHILFVSYTISR